MEITIDLCRKILTEVRENVPAVIFGIAPKWCFLLSYDGWRGEYNVSYCPKKQNEGYLMQCLSEIVTTPEEIMEFCKQYSPEVVEPGREHPAPVVDTDRDFDRYAADVQNGYGYYDEGGKFHYYPGEFD